MTAKHKLNLISPNNSERVITLAQSDTIEFLVKLFHIKFKIMVEDENSYLLRYEGCGLSITSYKTNKLDALAEILQCIGGGVC